MNDVRYGAARPSFSIMLIGLLLTRWVSVHREIVTYDVAGCRIESNLISAAAAAAAAVAIVVVVITSPKASRDGDGVGRSVIRQPARVARVARHGRRRRPAPPLRSLTLYQHVAAACQPASVTLRAAQQTPSKYYLPLDSLQECL